jgi:8-oxo-dGTP diphosphatase
LQPLPVTAALIRRGGRVLIAQRRAGDHQALLWEFPGGKIGFGERPEDALVREIEEELAYRIRVDSLFSVESHLYEHAGSRRHILLLVYLCSPDQEGEPTPVGAAAIAWVTPDEMAAYPFAPADWPVVVKLGGRPDSRSGRADESR